MDESGRHNGEAEPIESGAVAKKPSSGPTAPESLEFPPALRHTIPARIGPWTIISAIGRGGMGDVYKARRTDEDHWIVALKVGRPGARSAALSEAVRHEATLLMGLQGPNLVHIVDAGEFIDDDGERRAYYAMGYLRDARSIVRHAREESLDLPARLRLLEAACAGVQRAHERGVLHLDIKPDNLLVDDNGDAYVTDFGVARVLLNEEPRPAGGTHAYMSPEQLDGDPNALDARTDVYSMGVVGYELLAGRRPYAVDETASTAEARRRIEGARPLRAPLPPVIMRPLARAVAARKARRRPTMDALRRDLARGRALWRARWGVLLASALLCAAAGASLASSVGVPFVYRWTPLHRAWSAALSGVGAAGSEWSQTALVLFDPASTPFEALAVEAGEAALAWESLPLAERSVSLLRPVHAALCERLAESRARAVVFDLYFSAETPHDERLARGLRALVEAEVGVVLGEPSWQRRQDGSPQIAPRLLAERVDTGVIRVMDAGSGLVGVPLLADRPDLDEPPRSLAFAAYVASRRPGALSSVRFRPDRNEILIEHWTPDPSRPSGRRRAGAAESFRAFDTGRYTPNPLAAIEGLEAGDPIPLVTITVPSEEAVAPSLHRYEDVMRASTTDLQRWFGGKVVIIGQRKEMFLAGRMVVDPLIQGEATDMLLGSTPAPMGAGWRDKAYRGSFGLIGALIPLAGAGAGRIAAGGLFRRRPTLTTAALSCALALAAAGAAAALSATVFRSHGILLDPSVGVIAMALAGAPLLLLTWWLGPFARPLGIGDQ